MVLEDQKKGGDPFTVLIKYIKSYNYITCYSASLNTVIIVVRMYLDSTAQLDLTVLLEDLNIDVYLVHNF